MIRSFGLGILSLFFILQVKAQPYGNEWINYNKSYYAIPIAEDGIYRIYATDLTNAGIDLSSINPNHFQLYCKGEQVPLYLKGLGDNVFETADYLEFLGEKNTAWFDTTMYDDPDGIPNPYYSLINDTILYYLSWSQTESKLPILNETATSAGATAISYITYTSLMDLHSAYVKNAQASVNDPDFVKGEGFASDLVTPSASLSINLNTANIYSSGPAATLGFSLVSESNDRRIANNHQIELTVESTVFWDTVFNGYDYFRRKMLVDKTKLNPNNTALVFSSKTPSAYSDRTYYGYAFIEYPHTANFSDLSRGFFTMPDATGTKCVFNVTSYPKTGNVILYDLTNKRRISKAITAGAFELALTDINTNRRCYITPEDEVINISKIYAVNGNGKFRNFDDSAKDSAYVIISNKKIWSKAEEYGAYRSFSGYDTLMVDVEELYHQFAYGIFQHPTAIRAFAEYLVDNYPSPPSNLFLIGKSISLTQTRANTTSYTNNLVPSMGEPASDVFMLSKINDLGIEQAIPVGRLAASTSDHVDLYLEKTKSFESQSYDEWMKQTISFAGGTSISQTNIFDGYLSVYSQALTDTFYGAIDHRFRKSTTDPIQLNTNDSIRDLINGGVSLMTFFGHASATGGFDINIDDPSKMENKDRYPLLVGLSCLAGNLSLEGGQSTSEQFVLIRDKGVIGFLAAVAEGYDNQLHAYASRFFKFLGQTHYGESIGSIMKYTSAELKSSTTYIPIIKELTLHGDPAIRLNAPLLPDFDIRAGDVYTNPREITTDLDSFEVIVVVRNIGRTLGKPLNIEIKRTFGTGTDTTYGIITDPLFSYSDTINLTIPVQLGKAVGINTLEVVLDVFDEFEELSELNNSLEMSFLVKSKDLTPILPYKYAVVGEANIELIATSGSPLATGGTYVLQLDDNPDFSSPLETITITNAQGLVNWKPNALVNPTDSGVYFWRASHDSTDATGFKWKESSFQYIQGEEGWSQDHFYQFNEDEYLFLSQNFGTNQFEFSPSYKNIKVETFGEDTTFTSYDLLYINRIIVNNIEIEHGTCINPSGFHMSVFDSLTLDLFNQNTLIIDEDCNGKGAEFDDIYMFSMASQDTFLFALQNKVPNGSHVFIWSLDFPGGDFIWSDVSAALNTEIMNLGGDSVKGFENNTPYILYTQKGNPSQAMSVIGGQNEMISLFKTIESNAEYGEITSTLIGPASQWDSVSWRYSGQNVEDEVYIDLIGLDFYGNDSLLLDNVGIDSADIFIQSFVSADLFPYLKFESTLEDFTNSTAPQLNRWQVTYQGVPEAIINPALGYSFYADTVEEGELVTLQLPIQNITKYDMDSLLVSFVLFDQNRKPVVLDFPRQAPLLADSFLLINFSLNTEGYPGSNVLLIQINPNYDQIELTGLNNIAEVPFYVNSDKTNPLLDVTFDGVHILDGDIVSPSPQIKIQLTDENAFLPLDDTSDFGVYITYPGGIEKRLYFVESATGVSMRLSPATLNNGKKASNNRATIELEPKNLEDGTYSLKVRANDKSNNKSSTQGYEISFEVINQSSITNVLNYPNPFTTSTRFVFTLTGAQIPETFRIQILTISGRIVKEIDETELGPINIGRNITQYAWDGKDEFGDQLAKGVYLYKVITTINGESVDLRESGADSFMHKGFGKMYLLR